MRKLRLISSLCAAHSYHCVDLPLLQDITLEYPVDAGSGPKPSHHSITEYRTNAGYRSYSEHEEKPLAEERTATVTRGALYMRVSTVDRHPETQLLDLRQTAIGHSISTATVQRVLRMPPVHAQILEALDKSA